jgi:hypothetical protein
MTTLIPSPRASRTQQATHVRPTRPMMACRPLSAHHDRARSSRSFDARVSMIRTVLLLSGAALPCFSSPDELDVEGAGDACPANGSTKFGSRTSVAGTSLYLYEACSGCAFIGSGLGEGERCGNSSGTGKCMRVGPMPGLSGGCERRGSKPCELRRLMWRDDRLLELRMLCILRLDDVRDRGCVWDRLRMYGRPGGGDAAGGVHGQDVTNCTSCVREKACLFSRA